MSRVVITQYGLEETMKNKENRLLKCMAAIVDSEHCFKNNELQSPDSQNYHLQIKIFNHWNID